MTNDGHQWTHIPKLSWVVVVVEFFERLAYYGAAFTLSTYCTNMLQMSNSTANAVVNVLYIVAPLSACFFAGLSDGTFGRPRSLLICLLLYALGLGVMAWSSSPMTSMYASFPNGPTSLSVALFVSGIALFALGYGGMKVCTSPLTADATCDAFDTQELSVIKNKQQHPDALLNRGSHPSTTESVSKAAALADDCSDTLADIATSLDRKKKARVSFLFRLMYWSINFGSLFGIIGAPMLRDVDHRKVMVGDTEAHSGYYAGFLLCSCSTFTGLLVFLFFFRQFPKNKPSPTFVAVRVLWRALVTRVKFAVGLIHDVTFLDIHRGEFFVFASYGPDVTDEHRSFVVKVAQTARFCKSFWTLPLYWLISNQFSTNIVLSAQNMSTPGDVPPEMLNNVNTITLLVTVVIMDRWFVPVHQRPSVEGRLMVGFLLVTVAMLWCGGVGLFIDNRGTFDGSGSYALDEGSSFVSVLWLLPPYVLQGIASVFVDTTVLESAYLMAAPEMKSTVMALYLFASSVSGFLGLVFTPLAAPQLVTIMYFILALLQAVVAFVFVKMGSAAAAEDLGLRSSSVGGLSSSSNDSAASPLIIEDDGVASYQHEH